MSRFWVPLLVGVGMVLAAAPPAQAQTAAIAERAAGGGSASAIRFINDLLSQWRADQHLYVRGKLGLAAADLDSLESWLDVNGPHWTIVLMDSADGQRYENAEGRVATSMDAVELALADLASSSRFRELTHPATGEPDGAIFLLFLQERKFSYRASRAQDRRGLGASGWLGRLDRPAIRAMRGGGRIIDAVRDTVTTIDQDLSQAIASERQQQQQLELAARQALEEARGAAARVHALLEQIDAQAAAVRSLLPGAGGDLAQPDLQADRQRLAAIQQALAGQAADPQPLLAQTRELIGDLESRANRYLEFSRFEPSHEQLEQRWRLLQASSEADAARSALQAARQELDDAQSARDQGESEFLNRLNGAQHALEEAERLVQAEQKRRILEQQRRRLVRRTAAISTGFGSLLMLALLSWFNYRRRPFRDRARQQLDQRQAEVRKALEGVMELIERGQTVIGNTEELDRKGYQGRTLEVSRQALQDTDDLLVMSNSVERVVERAQDLIRPRSPWCVLANLFSARRFNEGFEILDREPIRFGADEGVSLVHDEQLAQQLGPDHLGASTQKQERAPGSTHPPAKQLDSDGTVTLSFSQLFQLFRLRAQRANKSIDLVEHGWSHITGQLQNLQQEIDEASQWERQARQAAETDGLFPIPTLFSVLLPSAQEDQDRGEEIAVHDPLLALEGPVASGFRKAREAKALAQALVHAREERLPGVDRGSVALQQRKRQNQWIADALETLGLEADAIAGEAVQRSIASEIEPWQDRLESLEQAVRQALVLDQRASDKIAPELQAAATRIDSARDEAARVLQLSPEHVLREAGQDPSESLAQAKAEWQAALVSLDRGDNEGAVMALDAADQRMAEAESLVQASLAALHDLPGLIDAARHRARAEADKTAPHEQLLAELQQEFAAEALRPQAADPSSADQEASVAECVPRAARRQQAAVDSLDAAGEAYAQGRLLQAAFAHQSAVEDLDQSQQQLERLQEHAREVRRQARDNVAFCESLANRLDRLQPELQDRRTLPATLQAGDEAQQRLQRIQQAVLGQQGRRQPFDEAAELAAIAELCDHLQHRLEVDRQAFAEAERSTAAIATQLSRAATLADQSARDRIPDSQATRQEVRAIQEFTEAHDKLRTLLQQPHQDWYALDRQADQLAAAVSTSAARLHGELRLAEDAVDAIRQAAEATQRAEQWMGDYGVRVSGYPGRQALQRARDLLSNGDYQGSLDASRQAQNDAQQAIQAAEREVARRLREQQRQLEQRRRATAVATGSAIGAARSAGSSWGAGGFSGGGHSQPSRPSSSGSSGGSGGFSRSGW